MTDRTEIRAELRRFHLGEAQVTTVLDGVVMRDAVRPPFCLDKSDDELQAIAAANRLPWDRMAHGFVPTLVETAGETVLIDAGFGAAGHADGTGQLVERLGRAGVAAADVTLVALTHVHPDHILGLRGPDGDAFPNARYAIGRMEFDEWKSGARVPPQREKNREMFLDIVVPLAERMTFLEDGDTVVPGLTAEAAFGHSPGHMMYRLESGGRQVLIWGDIANHYVFSLRHPESPVAFDDDREQAIATRKRVLDMAAADDLMVIGHHMPFPALGFVERDGPSYRWVPETYQTSV
ncbi:MBL fold metallo-hydrolase [Histidinibacterium lentulum]|uniref:MBL fold metallo-hydrolase n=1 Tax=Histidinibacterium lentulum TaxID=2480588 RepID=A0A3N2RA17_9RHOB|nr:MBL fold metallo-hydrolase [Histidinibacterium lentulum]ROU04255.1 MBL fold metallo-hydrolase [Histidinibacterium lentulum]